MFYLAIVFAFIGTFSVPSKEECVDAISEYFVAATGTGVEYASFQDLECAKDHFKNLFPEVHSKEDEKLFRASEMAIASISMDDIHRAFESPSIYYSLPISHEEERIIHKIISTLANKNIFSLLLERRDLERKGKQISHLHPFRFLGSIFSNPHLRSAMREVKKSTFKWDGFMDGLIPRMKEEASRDNLHRYIPGFAEHVKADPEKINYFIRHRNWDALVKYLMS